MPDVNSLKTTFLDAINTGLSSLGETPVSAPNNATTNVVLAKQIIQEVSRDIQSKGWWFNTNFAGQSGVFIHTNTAVDTQFEDFDVNLPEEARRYISIRASRILQSRFLGSEDLYKFSMMEEQVSYAVLTQAHVRNGGGATSFTSFPAELKGMGIEEFMFLQGNAEEKLLTIRLATELNTAAKLGAETALIGSQEELVDTQVLTEVQTGIKTAAESGLITAQQALVSQQVLEAVANISKIGAETLLIGSQDDLVVNQTATELKTALKTVAETSLIGEQADLVTQQVFTEVQNAIKVSAEAGLVTAQQALVSQQVLESAAKVLDIGADTVLKTAQTGLVVNQTATELKTALKTVAETTLLGSQDALVINQTATELQNAIKTASESGLITAQQALVSQQILESVETTLKTKAETGLISSQDALVVQQALTEVQTTLKVAAETTLLGSQDALVINQTATELQTAIKTAAESGLITAQQALVSQQVLESVAAVIKTTAESSLIGAQEGLVSEQTLTETETTLKTTAETGLVGSQSALVVNQTLTELENAIKVSAEAGLITNQQALVSQQVLESVSTVDKQTSEARLLDAQELLVDAQSLELTTKTAVEIAVEKSFYDGVVAGTQDTYRDYAAEMRMMGVQESTFQQFLAYKKIEVLKDAVKLRLSTATETGVNPEVNRILRLIGEPPVADVGDNALASECARLLSDTDTELQGRGWWFNTETDVELTKETSFTVSGIGGHWHGLYTYNSVLDRYEHVQANHTHYFSKTDSNGTNTVGTWSLSEEDAQGVFTASFDSDIGTGTWPDPALFEGGILSVDHVISLGTDVLYVEVEGVATFIKQVGGVSYLYDIKKKSYTLWPSNVLAKIIYQRAVLDLPHKFQEYLNVRVALILTELYPQSGADLQRLPKMEAELRIYFKDRDFDNANYTVFDNYDTVSRIGINRNYNLF